MTARKPITRKMIIDCLLHRFAGYVNCGICGVALRPGDDIEFDHIHPVWIDGPHEYQNLRPTHHHCNHAKGVKEHKAAAKTKRLANPKPSRHPMKSSGQKIPSRKFAKSAKPPRQARRLLRKSPSNPHPVQPLERERYLR